MDRSNTKREQLKYQKPGWKRLMKLSFGPVLAASKGYSGFTKFKLNYGVLR